MSIDVRLDEIVLRALEKNPTTRYQDASAFKTQVESAANSDNHSKSPVVPMGNLPKYIPWQIWFVVFILGLEGIANLFAIPTQPMAVIWVFGKVLFITGLLLRWRPVYVLVLVVCLIHGLVFYVPQPFGIQSFGPHTFGSLTLFGPNPWGVLVNLILLILLGSQFRFYFGSNTQFSSENSNLLFRTKVFSIISWLLAIPAIVFGFFFINALRSEQGGWHPNPSEAIFVPLTWVCSFLLPCLGWYLWKQSLPPVDHDSKATVTPANDSSDANGIKKDEIAGIMGVVLMLFLTATGDAIIMVVGAGIAVIAGLLLSLRVRFFLGCLLLCLASDWLLGPGFLLVNGFKYLDFFGK
ncbi:MAG: hypothetical protein HOH33_01650 [Verrucomicrobia bacterium]|nr:hypothetical protein [Verrucomicrobiota bacterium]